MQATIAFVSVGKSGFSKARGLRERAAAVRLRWRPAACLWSAASLLVTIAIGLLRMRWLKIEQQKLHVYQLVEKIIGEAVDCRTRRVLYRLTVFDDME